MDSGFTNSTPAATVLRWGMGLSFTLLIAGMIVSLGEGASGGRVSFDELRGIGGGLVALDGNALIHAGIVSLLATPIARVVTLLASGVARREWLFVAVAFGILLLLGASLALGLR